MTRPILFASIFVATFAATMLFVAWSALDELEDRVRTLATRTGPEAVAEAEGVQELMTVHTEAQVVLRALPTEPTALQEERRWLREATAALHEAATTPDVRDTIHALQGGQDEAFALGLALMEQRRAVRSNADAVMADVRDLTHQVLRAAARQGADSMAVVDASTVLVEAMEDDALAMTLTLSTLTVEAMALPSRGMLSPVAEPIARIRSTLGELPAKLGPAAASFATGRAAVEASLVALETDLATLLETSRTFTAQVDGLVGLHEAALQAVHGAAATRLVEAERALAVAEATAARTRWLLLLGCVAVAVALGVGVLASRRRASRMAKRLQEGLAAVRQGRLDARLDHFDSLGRSGRLDIIDVLARGQDAEWRAIRDAFNDMIEDLSRSHQALADRERFYRSLFEQGLMGMAIKDPAKDEWLLVNERFGQLLGYTPEAFVHRTWADLIHPEDAAVEAERYQALLRGEVEGYTLDTRFVTRAGDVLHAVLSVKGAFDEKGSAQTVYILLYDITRRVRAQAALDALNHKLEQLVEERSATLSAKTRELEAANERLQELDRLKSDFLSALSHELRTPLTSILGFTKLIAKELARMEEEPPAPAAFTARVARLQENLGIIAKEGERLTRLISELLDLTRIESGRAQWRDLICSPETLVKEAADAVRSQFLARPEVALTVETQPGLGALRVDPDRFLQVIINLLDNALKFTHQGEVRLEAAQGEDSTVRVSVTDTGMGVPPAELERIFDKFHQAPAADTLRDKPYGAGLGLAISSQIVAHYGGRIWAESTPGRGAVFHVEWPTLPPEASPMQTAGDVAEFASPAADQQPESG